MASTRAVSSLIKEGIKEDRFSKEGLHVTNPKIYREGDLKPSINGGHYAIIG